MSYSVEDFIRDIESGPYVWPGGYPKYFITHDGEAISFNSAYKNRYLISYAIKHQDKSDWHIVACDINWEDTSLYCADTNVLIPSTYGDE